MVGNYKILKILSEGGFGKTYLAEHSILKKKVVIKQSHFKSDESQKIILAEASLLWDITHWALPTVKDVIVTPDGDMLMVMSFIEGDELFQFTKKKGFLKPEEVCWIAQRIFSSLYYLHYNGIVHRDIKPANIIVNFKTHIATLVDFGLSKLKPDGKPDLSGYTPYFGSPEQIKGLAPIPESDIYSLGMTMIYLLGGNLKNKEVDVDISLKKFIHKMVLEEPLLRPRDCKKLNDELTEIRSKLFGRTHSK